MLLIEPINDIDIPGFYLTRTAQALDLLDEVGADNAFVQFVDNPGRHEPGTGELNWELLFAHLDRIGYRGQVGAEYKPVLTTEEGLDWLGRYAG